jgi:hypothetical protein
MSRRRLQRGEGMFGLIIGLAILFVVATSLIKIIPLHIHGAEVLDAMNEAANFGGLKPLDKLQKDILSRAQDARAPVELQNISVIRNGPYIVVQVKYEETADVLGFKYKYNFDKKIEKLVF